MRKNRSETFSFRFARDDRLALNWIAEELNRSQSDIIRILLQGFLKTYKKGEKDKKEIFLIKVDI